MDVVFSPQQRTSSTSKHQISSLFSIFAGHSRPLDPDSALADQNQCGSGFETLIKSYIFYVLLNITVTVFFIYA
jgi:hypothetical protein